MLRSSVILFVLVTLIEDLAWELCFPDLWLWPVTRCMVSACYTSCINNICVVVAYSFCSCGRRIDIKKTEILWWVCVRTWNTVHNITRFSKLQEIQFVTKLNLFFICKIWKSYCLSLFKGCNNFWAWSDSILAGDISLWDYMGILFFKKATKNTLWRVRWPLLFVYSWNSLGNWST